MRFERIRQIIKAGSNTFLPELAIVFVFFLTVSKYVGHSEKTLGADGGGYYDYLPSLFIHHDFIRKGVSETENPAMYERIAAIEAYGKPAEYRVNKYSCGTAILEMPFFLCALLTTECSGENSDGYQPSFQKSVLIAALFYLFLSLVFLKKLRRTKPKR